MIKKIVIIKASIKNLIQTVVEPAAYWPE